MLAALKLFTLTNTHEPEKTEEAIRQVEAFSRHFVRTYGAAD